LRSVGAVLPAQAKVAREMRTAASGSKIQGEAYG
jgi:hypothetical protein